MKYLATVNVPGYMPMDDDPPVFDTPREAWQHHVENLEREWDNYEDDPNGICLETHTMFHAQDQSQPGTIYAGTPGYEGNHDLGLAYCVVAVEDSDLEVEE